MLPQLPAWRCWCSAPEHPAEPLTMLQVHGDGGGGDNDGSGDGGDDEEGGGGSREHLLLLKP